MSNTKPSQSKYPEIEIITPGNQFIANQFFEITKLLGGEKSDTFGDTEKNYAPEICEWIDSFIEFLGNKSRRIEVIEFFETFETTTRIERADIIQFIEIINALEDTDEEEYQFIENDEPKKWRKVEMLRAIFAAFGLLRTDIIAGNKKTPTNPLINLYNAHVESGGKYRGALYPDNDAFVHFTPDSDKSEHFFTKLKNPAYHESVSLTLIVNTVPEEVDAVLSGELVPGDKGGLKFTDPSIREGAQGSDAKIGRYERRARDRQIKAEKMDIKAQKLNQEWYEGELKKLNALSAFLHERFEELRNHILENIPFISEVIDYLNVIKKLKAKGYEVDTLDVNELRKDFERLTKDYSRLITSKKSLNTKLYQDLTVLSDKISTATDFEQQKLQRRVSKIQGRIDTNNGDIQTYEEALKTYELESNDIFSQAEAYRLSAIPNIEQFTLGFYHSLRASELYSAPDHIPEIPVDVGWIEENIVPLFVTIIGTHLHRFHEVNTEQLYELMGKIDELPELYSDTTQIPDIDGVLQKKAGDFFAMLLPIIPKDYLEEIPNHRTIISPEGIYKPKEIAKKEPKIRKTHSQKRAEATTRKVGVKGSRFSLIVEMQSKEQALEQYEQYWRVKLMDLVRNRRAYFADIEKIDLKIRLRRAFPNKSKEELQGLIENSRSEELDIRRKISDGGYKSDEIGYKQLIDDRARIARKLGRLK